MWSKFGLILLVLAFGALLFAAGLSAPAAWRTQLAAVAAPVLEALKISSPTNATAAAPAATTDQAATADAGTAPAATEPLPYRSLLVPAPPPADAAYALEVALTADRKEADALVRALDALAQPATVVAVSDPAGHGWWLVAAGPFSTFEAANDAGLVLAKELKRGDRLAPILMPAPPAPAKAPG